MRFVTKLAAFLVAISGVALGQQINPHSQISWGANCMANPTYVYSPGAKDCIPAGGGSTPVGQQLTFTGFVVGSGSSAALGSISGVTTDSISKSWLGQYGLNVVDPTLPTLFQQQNVKQLVTTRATGSNVNGIATTIRVDHGWLNDDTHTQNVSSLSPSIIMHTDGQIGGQIGSSLVHYGKGDGVGPTFDLWCTGVSRGFDEGCEGDRKLNMFRGDNYGITINTMAVDAMGQTIVRPAYDGTGLPVSLTGHSVQASSESALVINTNPSKTYSTGNAQSISTCPSGTMPSLNSSYVCVTGDTGSNWTSHFGTSNVTTLTAAITDSGDFANGPVSKTVSVGSTTGITVGQLIAVSTNNDDFEMPTVIAVGTGTVTAYFSKAHPSGANVTSGGGIGYGISFPADDVQPGAWPVADGHFNGSVYRLAFPVIATLAGNVLVTTQFPYNQGTGLGTEAFAGTQITALPSYTPVVSGGAVTGFNIASVGNANIVYPSGTASAGGIAAPLPAITFTSGGCTTQPTAHTVFNDGGGDYIPVLDTPGAGCSSGLTAVITSSYANPYQIWPAAWSRSNLDPTYVVPAANTFQNQGDPNQVYTPSTAGYLALDGTIPGLWSVEDTIENVYNQHQEQQSQDSQFRKVLQVGVNGTAHYYNFKGRGTGDTLFAINNQEPAYRYFGHPSSHGGPDGAGGGVTGPPGGFSFTGSFSTIFSFQVPDMWRSNMATLFEVGCRADSAGDTTAPCLNGIHSPYYLWRDDSANAGPPSALIADPSTGNLTYSPRVNTGVFAAPLAAGTPVGGKQICLADGTNCPSTSTPVSGESVQTYTSGTIALDPTKSSNVINFNGSGAVTFSIAAGTLGAAYTFGFCYGPEAGYTVTPPAIVHGFMPAISTTSGSPASPSTCNYQAFTYTSAYGTAGYFATGPGMINIPQ